MTKQLVALTGLSRTGKDTLGAEFIAAGYTRVAMGDPIKRLFAPIIREIHDLDSFSEIDAEKNQFRAILVHGGEVPGIYEYVLGEMMAAAQKAEKGAINTRLFRPIEAEAWLGIGGQIWEIQRPGIMPPEPKELAYVLEMRERGMIHRTIVNSAPDADGWMWKSKTIVHDFLEATA